MERCSVAARALGEPAAGTGPVARLWLLVEQPGPWGADAANDSRLDKAVAAELGARAKRADTRLGLIRRPAIGAGDQDAAEQDAATVRHAYLAVTEPGARRLRRVLFTDEAELLALDLADPDTWPGEDVSGPILLVCTNGKRDVCCALAGRPLALALARAHPESVWEGSHLGGHRFAATAVVLPTGYVYGRLDPDRAADVLAEARAGRVVLDGCRGRSTWTRPGQVADLTVRGLLDERSADALLIGEARSLPPASSDGPDTLEAWQVPVSHRDGRAWTVRVAAVREDVPRPESCGKEPTLPVSLVATEVAPASHTVAHPHVS